MFKESISNQQCSLLHWRIYFAIPAGHFIAYGTADGGSLWAGIAAICSLQ